MRLHALIDDPAAARAAVEGGATILQLRIKGVSTETRVRIGREVGALGMPLIVNDDVDAALQLGAAGVHLGQDDGELDRAVATGLTVGRSVSTPEEARVAEGEGAAYLGAGPVWPTPSKVDAGEPIGLDGLAAICAATSLPVIAIGGIDAGNAAACLRAGARGVAVVRAARDCGAVRRALDSAAART